MKDEEILQRLQAIERYSLLAAKNVFTIDDAALYIGVTKSTIYKLTCEKRIPFYRPNGKLIYFDKKEIEDWMRQNRVGTDHEIEQIAMRYEMTGHWDKTETGNNGILNRSIGDLDFDDLRCNSLFERARIWTIGDLVKWRQSELIKFSGISWKTLDRINEVLKEHGLKLKEESK